MKVNFVPSAQYIRSERKRQNFHDWSVAIDAERAQWRAPRLRKFVELWERVRLCGDWTPITVLGERGQSNGEGRWLRRQLMYLEAAGLIDRVVDGKITYFRMKENA